MQVLAGVPGVGDWLPQVTNSLSLGGIGIWIFVIYHIITHSLKLSAEGREWRKLSAEDRVAKITGFEAQVKVLQEELRNRIDDMQKEREQYDLYRRQCEKETDGLRRMVIALEARAAGDRRRLDYYIIVVGKMSGIPIEKLMAQYALIEETEK